jgi:hypothetical protein
MASSKKMYERRLQGSSRAVLNDRFWVLQPWWISSLSPDAVLDRGELRISGGELVTTFLSETD